jgi:hypothetical protein
VAVVMLCLCCFSQPPTLLLLPQLLLQNCDLSLLICQLALLICNPALLCNHVVISFVQAVLQ